MISAITRRRRGNDAASQNITRLTITDLCNRWGVSLRTIERKIEDGIIPKPIMLGGRCWFLTAIEEYERTANQ